MGDRREVRVAQGLEIRKGSSGSKVIAGHAAVFDKLSDNLGGFREKVRKGAFSRAISEGQDVRALLNHDSNMVLGRTKSGTLRIYEDDEGLAIEIDPPDTQIARDVVTSIERGDIDQMSFAFSVQSDEWRTEGGEEIRELIDVDLFDVSPVTYPAYPDTDVAVRSMKARKGLTFDAEGETRRITLDAIEAGIL